MSALNPFAPGTMTGAALLLMRLTGLILIAPIYSTRSVPGQLKAALLAILTIALLPVALAGSGSLELSPVTMISEAVIGLTLGLGAAVFVAAAQASGDMLAIQMGLSGANVLDPMSQSQMPVLGQFMGLFTVTMIMAVGGHLLMLSALATSLDVLPLGATVNFADGVQAATRTGGLVFLLGVRFAAPVVGAMMMGNVTLGILARTVPQLNVLMVAFPVQIAIGLAALGISLPIMATFFGDWPEHYAHVVSDVLQHFAPLGGGR